MPLLIGANLVVIAAGAYFGAVMLDEPARYFREGRVPTYFSVLQLLACAALSMSILWHRLAEGGWAALCSERGIWAAIALGFCYLALDDAARIHERVGRQLGGHFGNAPWAAHMDDILIGSYGVVGLILLYLCRHELLLFRQQLLKPFIAGFIALYLSVVCDAAAHGYVLAKVAPNPEMMPAFHTGFMIWDSGFMLLAEGCFLAGFYAAWRQAAGR